MRLTFNELSEFIICSILAGSILTAVLTAALRFGIRPLLADWSKFKAQAGNPRLEARVVALEDELRMLKRGNLQLPVDVRPKWQTTDLADKA